MNSMVCILYKKRCYSNLITVDNITTDTVHHFVPHWNGRYLAANVYFKDLQTNKTTQIG